MWPLIDPVSVEAGAEWLGTMGITPPASPPHTPSNTSHTRDDNSDTHPQADSPTTHPDTESLAGDTLPPHDPQDSSGDPSTAPAPSPAPILTGPALRVAVAAARAAARHAGLPAYTTHSDSHHDPPPRPGTPPLDLPPTRPHVVLVAHHALLIMTGGLPSRAGLPPTRHRSASRTPPHPESPPSTPSTYSDMDTPPIPYPEFCSDAPPPPAPSHPGCPRSPHCLPPPVPPILLDMLRGLADTLEPLRRRRIVEAEEAARRAIEEARARPTVTISATVYLLGGGIRRMRLVVPHRAPAAEVCAALEDAVGAALTVSFRPRRGPPRQTDTPPHNSESEGASSPSKESHSPAAPQDSAPSLPDTQTPATPSPRPRRARTPRGPAILLHAPTEAAFWASGPPYHVAAREAYRRIGTPAASVSKAASPPPTSPSAPTTPQPTLVSDPHGCLYDPALLNPVQLVPPSLSPSARRERLLGLLGELEKLDAACRSRRQAEEERIRLAMRRLPPGVAAGFSRGSGLAGAALFVHAAAIAKGAAPPSHSPAPQARPHSPDAYSDTHPRTPSPARRVANLKRLHALYESGVRQYTQRVQASAAALARALEGPPPPSPCPPPPGGVAEAQLRRATKADTCTT